MRCPACHSRDIDFHEAGGHSYCVSCGNLVEESTIVSSIEFQENGDRSQVIGQFVAANCSRPYSSSVRTKGRFGSGRDSRDITIFKMKQIITQVAASLNMPEDGIIDRALALYRIAMEKNFVFGRRQIHVASTCLYAMCRKEAKPHLLIDFSDALQVNIYILGKSFLQFIRLLNLKLPIIDPSLYIHRFALRLEVGEKINSVITIALRIVTRLKKDWIVMGRRPDGICAAAMLISARAHGFPTTQSEVSKIFRISADTVKSRLDEFKATPSAQLSVTQFSHHDSTVEFDPPSYIRNLLADNVTQQPIVLSLEEEKGDGDEADPTTATAATALGARSVPIVSQDGSKTKDKEGDVDDDDDDDEEQEEEKVPSDDERDEDYRGSKRRTATRPQSTRNQKNAKSDKSDKPTVEETGPSVVSNAPTTDGPTVSSIIDGVEVHVPVPGTKRRRGPSERHMILQREREVFYEDISAELEYSASDAAAAAASRASSQRPARRGKQDAVDAGTSAAASATANEEDIYEDEDEDEEEILDVDVYLLDEEETQKKSAIWDKSFKTYMEEMAVKRRLREQEQEARATSGRSRKKVERRGANSARATASQAVMSTSESTQAQKRTSKKINYDALKGAFDSQGNFAIPSSLRGEADTYPLPTGNLSVGMDRMLPPTGLPTTSVLNLRPSTATTATTVVPAVNTTTTATSSGNPAVAVGSTISSTQASTASSTTRSIATVSAAAASSSSAPSSMPPPAPMTQPIARAKRGRPAAAKSAASTATVTPAPVTPATVTPAPLMPTPVSAPAIAIAVPVGSAAAQSFPNIPTILPMSPSSYFAQTAASGEASSSSSKTKTSTTSTTTAAGTTRTSGSSSRQSGKTAVPKKTAVVGVKSRADVAKDKAAREAAESMASLANATSATNAAPEQEFVHEDNTTYAYGDEGDDE